MAQGVSQVELTVKHELESFGFVKVTYRYYFEGGYDLLRVDDADGVDIQDLLDIVDLGSVEDCIEKSIENGEPSEVLEGR